MKLEELPSRPQRTQIMTLQELAKYLGVHPITIYRLLKESNIPAIKIGGQWRFKKDVLDEWLLKGMLKKRKQ
ncbi:helix-turn-helix domain-containing protein [Candidatus Omnitrophota bacterium]